MIKNEIQSRIEQCANRLVKKTESAYKEIFDNLRIFIKDNPKFLPTFGILFLMGLSLLSPIKNKPIEKVQHEQPDRLELFLNRPQPGVLQVIPREYNGEHFIDLWGITATGPDAKARFIYNGKIYTLTADPITFDADGEPFAGFGANPQEPSIQTAQIKDSDGTVTTTVGMIQTPDLRNQPKQDVDLLTADYTKSDVSLVQRNASEFAVINSSISVDKKGNLVLGNTTRKGARTD